MKRQDVAQAAEQAVDSGFVHYSSHAAKRMRERGVTATEIRKVLRDGHRYVRRDRMEDGAWKYAMRGNAFGRSLVAVFGFETIGGSEWVVAITVFEE